MNIIDFKETKEHKPHECIEQAKAMAMATIYHTYHDHVDDSHLNDVELHKIKNAMKILHYAHCINPTV